MSNRPMLLIEPSYKVNGEDRTKNQARSARANVEEDVKGTAKSVPDTKVEAKGDTNSSTDSKSRPTSDDKAKDMQKSDSYEAGKTPKVETKDDLRIVSKSSSDPKLSANAKTVVNTDNKSVEEPSSAADSSSKPPQKVGQDTSSVSSTDLGGRRLDNAYSTSHSKQDVRQQVAQTPTTKPSLEENIVLGVALDGSKRTLPIEEEMVSPPNPEDTKELATLRSGNGPAVPEEKNDSKRSNTPGSPSNDQSEQQD